MTGKTKEALRNVKVFITKAALFKPEDGFSATDFCRRILVAINEGALMNPAHYGCCVLLANACRGDGIK